VPIVSVPSKRWSSASTEARRGTRATTCQTIYFADVTKTQPMAPVLSARGPLFGVVIIRGRRRNTFTRCCRTAGTPERRGSRADLFRAVVK
jgi:hypothetical protein